MKKTGLILWAVIRLPLLALALYLMRDDIITFIDDRFGLGEAIEFVVYTAGTFSTRLLLYLACALGLGIGYWLTQKLIPNALLRFVLFLFGAFSIVFVSFNFFLLTSGSLSRALLVTIILAFNTTPDDWLEKLPGRLMDVVCLSAVGWVEALLPQTYIFWLTKKYRNGNPIKMTWLAGILLVPFYWVFVFTPFNSQRVLTFGEKLHANPSVQKFAQGRFNWIELNPEQGMLYAVGHGTRYLLAFDVTQLEKPPTRSITEIGKTQSFAFNPERQEIYAMRAETGELLYLDALTLKAFKSVPIKDISPGDVWIAWDRITDSIVVASEADRETGTPFFMFDRESGAVLATIPLPVIPTAFLIFHPDEPRMYFNSFKDTYLVAWDTLEHQVVQKVETSQRTDRMAFSPATSEVLVASPLDGAILRYDAETLEYKGDIPASFGDRTLSIDPKRNLLLVGNFINNRMQVIDLKTNEPLASFYLGPWIRTIALDAESGIAYVSTIHNLFKVDYVTDVYPAE